MKILVKGILSALLLSSAVAKADCTALFNDLHSYIQPATIGNCKPNFNTLYVRMATNRSDNRYVSYAEGYTTQKISGGGRFPVVPSFGGVTSQTFSDRSKDVYESRCDGGAFCLATKQNFPVSTADQLGLNFTDTTATLTLRSWGNGKIAVPVACTASGVMYGEKDGTFFTFSFLKTVYENTCVR